MLCKTLLPIFICCVVVISCAKSGSDANGTWSLLQGSNPSLNTSIADRIDRHMENGFAVTSAYQKNKNVKIRLWFNQWPQASQQFTVVDFLRQRQLDADEMGITVDVTHGSYYSTGMKNVVVNHDPADKVSVTVTDGKLQLVIPGMSGYSEDPEIDSAYFYGSFSEK